MMTIRSTYPEWIYDGSEIEDTFGDGERAVQWLWRFKHPKSRLPKRAFQLDPWQERIVRRIYGPRKPDGSRIVNTVVILVPRGNRKTSLSAALALLHTIGSELVSGGEAIFAASDRMQAGIAFREARGIIQADSKHLVPATKIYDAHNSAKKILYPKENVSLEVISSDAPGQEGRTPNFVLADEVHIWHGERGRDLWKVLTNGLDKIDNSLLVVATTAGRGQDSIAHEVIERARKVARGEIIDPSVLPVLFEADPACDWASEDVWRRVNPGSVHGYPSIEGFRRHVARAKESPTERDSLKQYKLNIWLDHSSSPFVEMAVYDEGNGSLDLDALARDAAQCWLGVDMSISRDLTAIVSAWRDGDGGYLVYPIFFCPGDTLSARENMDGVNYREWAKDGHIIPTPGPVIDYRRVADEIRSLCDRFNVQEIAFDPNRATLIMSDLVEEGLPVVSFDQSWRLIGPATDLLHHAITGRKFRHGGHPVLRWNFSNIAVVRDRNDNIGMHKGKSRDRIDGAVAAAMAVARAAAGEEQRSIFDVKNFDPMDFVC